jgi:sugar lactone lactonase YvrE
VRVFTPDGVYLREQAGFLTPMGIAIDENDVVFVLEHCRVHRFTVDFQPLGSWDSCIGQGDLQMGRGLDAHGGIVCIAAAGNVLKFTTDGALLDQFPNGWTGVHISPDGSIWVVRGYKYVGLVRHYASDGTNLGEWNTILPGETVSSPRGLAIDSNGRIFVADEGAKVKIFLSDGSLDDLIQWQLRVFASVALDGDSTLYVGTGFPESIMKFHYEVVPVDPSSWGQIKARYH